MRIYLTSLMIFCIHSVYGQFDVQKDTILKLVQKDTTLKLVQKDTTLKVVQKDTVINPLTSVLDSVFTVAGDTLLGKVFIDKDNDRFIFESKDTFTMELLPSKIKKFTYNLTEHNGERVTYIAILHDFYFLEFGEHDPMRGYARYTYRSVENDGPKYYVISKKYCFFKGKVPLFPRIESFKSDLLLLIDDCPKVVRKVQSRDIKMEELAQYVIEYNNCSGRIKK